MIDDEICRLLNDRGFGVFEIRDRGFGDTLFLSPDRRRPRLLVTMEAKADHPGQIDAAVEDAIELLKTGGGGDVVIRLDHDDPTCIKAVRESIPPSR
jgi:hypothetical protein